MRTLLALLAGLNLFLGSSLMASPQVAIRFDPGFLYDSQTSHTDLARKIDENFEYWKFQKVSRVYILFNNPVYGAFFASKIPAQPSENNFSKSELLKKLVTRLRKNKIEVYAWFYPLRAKHVWQEFSDWRAPYCSGPNEFLLDAQNEQVRRWYLGLVAETINHYPRLNGIDIAEPLSAQNCAPAELHRTQALTRLILDISKMAKQRHLGMSLTPNIPVHTNGNLWGFQEFENSFGVDLYALLKKIHWNVFLPQLNFQEWPQNKSHQVAFDPGWADRALTSLKKNLKQKKLGATRMGIHLEFVDLKTKDLIGLRNSLQNHLLGQNFWGTDFYDSHLAIEMKVNLQWWSQKNHSQRYSSKTKF